MKHKRELEAEYINACLTLLYLLENLKEVTKNL